MILSSLVTYYSFLSDLYQDETYRCPFLSIITTSLVSFIVRFSVTTLLYTSIRIIPSWTYLWGRGLSLSSFWLFPLHLRFPWSTFSVFSPHQLVIWSPEFSVLSFTVLFPLSNIWVLVSHYFCQSYRDFLVQVTNYLLNNRYRDYFYYY